jgi:cardiolipin synthase
VANHDAVSRYFLHPQLAEPGHAVQVLFGGEQAYPAMLLAIATAQQEILLETYTWSDDELGRRFAAALIERARTGVRVRCVIDGIGSFGFDSALADELRRNRIELAVFHPVAPWRRRAGLSVRDHRKLLVVDGQVAFLGGLNLSRQYAPKEWGGHGWHDVHVRVEGPAAFDLERLFAKTWRYTAGERLALAAHRPQAAGREPLAVASSTANVQVLAIDTRRSRRLIRRHYEHALRRARRQIVIMAAYFIPDRGLRAILRKAVGRGVEVRVLLPHHSDVPIVQEASRHTYAALLRAGVQIYEWLPAMLHAKTIVVDGEYCAIGSYNLDRRSLLYNWELSMATDDARTCRAIEADFERSLQSARRIDRAQWHRRGMLARLIQWFAYLFRNWL